MKLFCANRRGKTI